MLHSEELIVAASHDLIIPMNLRLADAAKAFCLGLFGLLPSILRKKGRKMNYGFRVNYDVKRPDLALVDQFKGIPVANIADEMNRMNCMTAAIKPFNKTFLVGTAITVKTSNADNLMFHKALDIAKPGDVIVVSCIGDPDRSICGEIMMRHARLHGLRGFVIDGLIRDSDGASQFDDFAVYAKGVTPLGPYKFGPGEINVPIACGRQVVFPGDVLVGDQDGIIVLRPDELEFALAAGKRHCENEARIMAAYDRGEDENRDWVDAQLKKMGCEF